MRLADFSMKWELTLKRLREILPNIEYCTPSAIVDKAEKSVHPMRQYQKDAFDPQDPLIFEKVIGLFPEDENLILITDRSFLKDQTPYLVRRSQAQLFRDLYSSQTGEDVFSGADLIVFGTDTDMVFLYHHEGYAFSIGQSQQ